MDSLSFIAETLTPLAGKTVLDIGCGSGGLARALAARGADVIGIDPSVSEVEAARDRVPDARFERAAAEALPVPDASVDGAVFLNSLHHVPADLMAAALAEAARVTRDGGVVIVIEPLAEGSFFHAFQPVEDETLVRTQAQAAIEDALRSKAFVLGRTADFVRRERFDGLDAFLTRVLAADPRRSSVISRQRAVIEAAFLRNATVDDEGGYMLDQPLRAVVLHPGEAGPQRK